MLKRLKNLVAPSLTVEQRATNLAGQQITYTLKRSAKRRSIGLRIDHRGLTVSMPLRASEKWLHTVLQEKAQWVVAKLQGWQSREIVEPSWSEGEVLDYLGEQLTLRVERSLFVQPAQKYNNALWVFAKNCDDASKVKHAVTQWYRQQALSLFTQRIEHFSPLMNVSPEEIKLSTAKTQWGSCNVRGTVSLNLQLIKLPPRLIDYVVVHELAHLREMNHSAAFWDLVESACPDYLTRRAELKAISL